MLPIPQDVLAKFDALLRERAVPAPLQSDYRKWLRYFLDFRGKYPLPNSRSEQVRLFIEKLRVKKQTPKQQSQAAHALSLFFESQLKKTYNKTSPARINIEKTVKATNPSTPSRNHNSPYPPLILRGGGEAGGVTVKGESSQSSQYRATLPTGQADTGGLPLQVSEAATTPLCPLY